MRGSSLLGLLPPLRIGILARCGECDLKQTRERKFKGLNCAALDKILNGIGKINGADKISSATGACCSVVNLKGIVRGRGVKTAALIVIVLI